MFLEKEEILYFLAERRLELMTDLHMAESGQRGYVLFMLDDSESSELEGCGYGIFSLPAHAIPNLRLSNAEEEAKLKQLCAIYDPCKELVIYFSRRSHGDGLILRVGLPKLSPPQAWWLNFSEEQSEPDASPIRSVAEKMTQELRESLYEYQRAEKLLSEQVRSFKRAAAWLYLDCTSWSKFCEKKLQVRVGDVAPLCTAGWDR